MKILIIATIIGMLVFFYFKTQRKVTKQQLTGLEEFPKEDLKWTFKELILLKQINNEREKIGKKPFEKHHVCKSISAGRVAFWIKHNYNKTKNLHDYFLGVKEDFESKKILDDVSENTGFGYEDIFKYFMESPDHRKNILSDRQFIGITIKSSPKIKNYCDVIFSNK